MQGRGCWSGQLPWQLSRFVLHTSQQVAEQQLCCTPLQVTQRLLVPLVEQESPEQEITELSEHSI
jgi:hypothetical protein